MGKKKAEEDFRRNDLFIEKVKNILICGPVVQFVQHFVAIIGIEFQNDALVSHPHKIVRKLPHFFTVMETGSTAPRRRTKGSLYCLF
jgi:hypothetical protein